MRKRLLFLAVMVGMAFTAVKAESTIMVKGQEIAFSGGTAKVDNILLFENKTTKQVTVFLYADEEGGSTITTPYGEYFFNYNGEDYEKIVFYISRDITIRSLNSRSFSFFGRPATPVEVNFMSQMGNDVTLTLVQNSTEEGYYRQMFYLAYSTLNLNGDSKAKVNINFQNDSEGGSIFYGRYPSTVNLGYGDYHMVAQFHHTVNGVDAEANFNFFTGELTVYGLKSDNLIYYSQPRFGAHLHTDGTSLIDCNDNQIMGEVTLTYLPQGYQSIEGSDAEWRITQSCEDGVKLYVYGAGDMTEIEKDKLGWLEYKDFITQIEVCAFEMYDPFTALPNYAFEKMENLKSVRFIKTYDLNKLSYSLFDYCTNLETVDMTYYDGDLKEIDRYAFNLCTSLKSFTIPETVKTLRSDVFRYCESLTSMTIPDNVTDFGANIFEECTNLTSVTLPKGITEIPFGMFSGCEKLASLTIPSSVTSIKSFAFQNCGQLTSIDLPDGITSIGISAFTGSGLMEVTLPKGLKQLAVGAFACASLEKVTIPAEIEEVKVMENEYNDDVSFTAVNDIRFGGDDEQWLSYDRRWLMENVAADTRLYFGEEEAIEASVPESFTRVPAFAFRNVSSLEYLSLPSGITEIGESAFAGCERLNSIDIYSWNPPALGDNALKDFSGIITTWYTARENYKNAEGWKELSVSNTDLFMWPSSLRDVYAEVSIQDGQEEMGSVRLEVPEEYQTGYVSETKVSVKDGGSFTMIAEPKENFRFVKWEHYYLSGAMMSYEWGKCSTEKSYTAETYISMYGSFNEYRAVFEAVKDSFDVNVTVNGIDPDLVEIIGAGRYAEGDEAKLSFNLKDDHYEFDHWTYDGKFWEPEEVLDLGEITKNRNVQIYFNGKKYMVTATVIPAGAGEVLGQGEYAYGSTYGLKVVPNEGYELKEWRDGTALDEKGDILNGFVYGEIHIECELQKKEPTGLDNASEDSNKAVKVMRDGKLYILKGGKMYNALGKELE